MHDDEGLRERLVRAGAELVAQEGSAAVSLREIARRAGVSHGAPRRHFPTHVELLSAIARQGFADLTTRLRAVPDTGTPRDRLGGLAHAYVGFAQEHRGMYELMFRHDLLRSDHLGLRETSLPLFETLADLLTSVSGDGTAPAAEGREPRPDVAGREPRRDVAGREPRRDVAGREPRRDVARPELRRDVAGREPRPGVAGPELRRDVAGPEPRPGVAGPELRRDVAGREPRPGVAGPELRRDVAGPEPRPDATTAAGALWANLHGIAQLWLWGSLPLATGQDDIGALVDAALDAHAGGVR
ncbi:TetR/AcrR family transcriptional regulator [Dactylosporangium sp. CA-052675]|uniref:TetR/AcrR family transcriptional regulator n=1 Tax=Dactylosporangium sp. CA-052675 TaxID=3239927 RepID=UPI003D8FF0D1